MHKKKDTLAPILGSQVLTAELADQSVLELCQCPTARDLDLDRDIGVARLRPKAQVWLLLSRDFILLVVIGCMIATPLAFYFLSNWLRHYDYRIGIGPGVFLLSAGMALLITLLTVSFQAIRAALANPVTALRSE